MKRAATLFGLAFILAFILDQGIKQLILDGYRWQSQCIDITLTYNKGVAFSMFAFLGPWLKYLQILLIGGAALFVFYKRYVLYYALPLGLLLGAGSANLLDRFVHGGVVDYVYWHCGFDFAVFNLADATIDLGVAWILWIHFRKQ